MLGGAFYHAHQRQTFGKNLIDQPLMRDVLGRMALGAGGTHGVTVVRLARAWDNRNRCPQEVAWARLFTPAAKITVCKAGIPFVAEAMEVLGGAGYCGRE
ncbi:hypothetical protein MJ588_03035 [Klebsiella pneumoniae]|nr:hypothetical protein MJ588_03035 [Klebsiella pneumoniae]